MTPSEREEIEKVYQRREDDCFRACVATILGISYESINEPDIKLPTSEWLQAWRIYLNSLGFDICFFNYSVMDEWLPKGYSIGVGVSPRGKDHAVICLDGKPFFDPYKNSSGFPDKFDCYGIITLIKPFELVGKAILTQVEKARAESEKEIFRLNLEIKKLKSFQLTPENINLAYEARKDAIEECAKIVKDRADSWLFGVNKITNEIKMEIEFLYKQIRNKLEKEWP